LSLHGGADGLSLTSRVCPAAVQARRFAQHTSRRRTSQSVIKRNTQVFCMSQATTGINKTARRLLISVLCDLRISFSDCDRCNQTSSSPASSTV